VDTWARPDIATPPIDVSTSITAAKRVRRRRNSLARFRSADFFLALYKDAQRLECLLLAPSVITSPLEYESDNATQDDQTDKNIHLPPPLPKAASSTARRVSAEKRHHHPGTRGMGRRSRQDLASRRRGARGTRAATSGDRDQCEPQDRHQKDAREPIYEAETIRVGVVMDACEVDSADENEHQ
jgi:hypothetical protein